MALDADVVTLLSGPITTIWQDISADIIQCAADSGDQFTNRDAIACCLDGAQMPTHGFSQEMYAVLQLHSEHGEQTVLDFLASNIQLIT